MEKLLLQLISGVNYAQWSILFLDLGAWLEQIICCDFVNGDLISHFHELMAQKLQEIFN